MEYALEMFEGFLKNSVATVWRRGDKKVIIYSGVFSDPYCAIREEGGDFTLWEDGVGRSIVFSVCAEGCARLCLFDGWHLSKMETVEVEA